VRFIPSFPPPNCSSPASARSPFRAHSFPAFPLSKCRLSWRSHTGPFSFPQKTVCRRSRLFLLSNRGFSLRKLNKALFDLALGKETPFLYDSESRFPPPSFPSVRKFRSCSAFTTANLKNRLEVPFLSSLTCAEKVWWVLLGGDRWRSRYESFPPAYRVPRDFPSEQSFSSAFHADFFL